MRDIPGYEGLYAVTSCGKVWSYRKQIFLKPAIDKDGYLLVNLCKDKTKKMCRVHRLVAEAYLPNPSGLPQVNHKNEVKIHNFINNLEWCDAKYNANYGTKTQRAVKKTAKKIYCVELDKIFLGIHAAARELGLHASNITACCAGRAKTTGGYHWRFVE